VVVSAPGRYTDTRQIGNLREALLVFSLQRGPLGSLDVRLPPSRAKRAMASLAGALA
jgi:hypothetical protein